MTKPHEASHRTGCNGPMKKPQRVGSWWITRCAGCGATEARKATNESETEK